MDRNAVVERTFKVDGRDRVKALSGEDVGIEQRVEEFGERGKAGGQWAGA